MCPACIAAAAWLATGASSAGIFLSLAIKFPDRTRKIRRSESTKRGTPGPSARLPLVRSKGENPTQQEIASPHPAEERSR
jgi:hypothetical protein